MSNSSLPGGGRSRSISDAGSLSELLVATRQALPRVVRNSVGAVTRPARAIAFWSAIALPFLSIALLVRGLSDTTDTVAFLVLLVANLVALYVGRSHRRAE